MDKVFGWLKSISPKQLLTALQNYFRFIAKPMSFWSSIEKKSGEDILLELLTYCSITVIIVFVSGHSIDPFTVLRNIGQDIFFAVCMTFPAIYVTDKIFRKYRKTTESSSAIGTLIFILYVKLLTYPWLLILISLYEGNEISTFLILHNILIFFIWNYIFVFSRFILYSRLSIKIGSVFLGLILITITELFTFKVLLTSPKAQENILSVTLDPIRNELFKNLSRLTNVKQFPTWKLVCENPDTIPGFNREMFAYLPLEFSEIEQYKLRNLNIDLDKPNTRDSLYRDTILRAIDTLNAIQLKVAYKLNKEYIKDVVKFYQGLLYLVDNPFDSIKQIVYCETTFQIVSESTHKQNTYKLYNVIGQYQSIYRNLKQSNNTYQYWFPKSYNPNLFYTWIDRLIANYRTKRFESANNKNKNI